VLLAENYQDKLHSVCFSALHIPTDTSVKFSYVCHQQADQLMGDFLTERNFNLDSRIWDENPGMLNIREFYSIT
jgi:hypothetical protein